MLDKLLIGVIVVAFAAVIVSTNSQTSNFLTSAFNALTSLITTVMQPTMPTMIPGSAPILQQGFH